MLIGVLFLMKNIVLAGILVLLAACATVNPLQEANIETGVIYKFTNPTLSTSLYVKLLPTTAGGGELLFKTVRNEETLTSLELGSRGVYHQKAYLVSERGKVSFHHVEEGLFEELHRHHQYSSYGLQQGELAIFRYRLDFRKAVKLQ